MSPKPPLGGLKWLKKHLNLNIFTKNCNEDGDIGYFFEIAVQYCENLHELHNALPYFPERMIIEKVAANLYDHEKIRYTNKKFKTSIKSCISIKKLHRVMKLNQEAFLKP